MTRGDAPRLAGSRRGAGGLDGRAREARQLLRGLDALVVEEGGRAAEVAGLGLARTGADVQVRDDLLAVLGDERHQHLLALAQTGEPALVDPEPRAILENERVVSAVDRLDLTRGLSRRRDERQRKQRDQRESQDLPHDSDLLVMGGFSGLVCFYGKFCARTAKTEERPLCLVGSRPGRLPQRGNSSQCGGAARAQPFPRSRRLLNPATSAALLRAPVWHIGC